MEKGMATDWFSVSMMPPNRVDAACRRWEGGEKSGNSVLLQDTMACLPHTASTLLAGITLTENQSLPTPFPIKTVYLSFFFILYNDQPMNN
jgi:hypothetical protein